MHPTLTPKAAALYGTPLSGTIDDDFDSLIEWLAYMERYDNIPTQQHERF